MSRSSQLFRPVYQYSYRLSISIGNLDPLNQKFSIQVDLFISSFKSTLLYSTQDAQYILRNINTGYIYTHTRRAVSPFSSSACCLNTFTGCSDALKTTNKQSKNNTQLCYAIELVHVINNTRYACLSQ